jgi:hypothetical protein
VIFVLCCFLVCFDFAFATLHCTMLVFYLIKCFNQNWRVLTVCYLLDIMCWS